VRDANGQALAYAYSGASEADARQAKVLTEDEAAPDRGEHCEAAGVAQARGLTMWWIWFLHGVVVIIKASSLIHARTLAALYGLGRVSHFAEGPFINPERAALIPDDFIARMLSPIEARHLRNLLEHGPREYRTDDSRESRLTSPRRRA
jgi:hypothetical protein